MTTPFDDFGRPRWDYYFLSLCLMTAQRSLDPSTKHGCIVVDDDKTILSVGYNSPPRGCCDKDIPLTRPEKYPYFRHAEDNAISNAARIGVSLKSSTFYVTGMPCPDCFGKIKNVGAKRIVHCNIQSHMITEKELNIIKVIDAANPIQMDVYDSPESIHAIFDKVTTYYDSKKNVDNSK
jgi:deoxycytidylate deaminase